jgi:hypothetical protein
MLLSDRPSELEKLLQAITIEQFEQLTMESIVVLLPVLSHWLGVLQDDDKSALALGIVWEVAQRFSAVFAKPGVRVHIHRILQGMLLSNTEFSRFWIKQHHHNTHQLALASQLSIDMYTCYRVNERYRNRAPLQPTSYLRSSSSWSSTPPSEALT